VQLARGSRLIIDGVMICGATMSVVDAAPQEECPPPSSAAPCGCEPSAAGPAESPELTDVPSADRPSTLLIRHATFVPGGRAPERSCGCEPNHASLSISLAAGRLVIAQSVVGTLNIEHPACERCESSPPSCPQDPLVVEIADSIVDAAWGRAAIASECCWPAHADLTIERTTVLGDVCAQQISRAEDSLFMGVVHVQRRAHGYMRFCYVPTDAAQLPQLFKGQEALRLAAFLKCAWDRWLKWASDWGWSPSNCCPLIRTPRRFKCVPEAGGAVDGNACGGSACGNSSTTPSSPVSPPAPTFVSTRYGDPGYCELAWNCCPQIGRGAEDQSELGAFHDNYWPQRAAALEARLQEYTPADFEAAVIYADDLYPTNFCQRAAHAGRHSLRE
jgi:hypothetical protein